ncbi:MAG: EamA family transporter [Clostridia bacterium]|nr:EamA family transporter [Clostridia bacterium]
MREEKNTRAALLSLIGSMVIFGTIGVFRRHIPLPSSMIAMMRGLIGMSFLLLVLRVKHQKPDGKAIRRNAVMLLLSGALLGFNWILLFEAYRYTSVATATLCYYMAPILVMLLSPALLGERLTRKKALCVLAALAGMVLVSGVLQAGFAGGREVTGVLFGLGAAALYCGVILTNKRIRDISAYDKTIVQLGTSAALLLPYTLLTERITGMAITGGALAMLLLVGVVHTGVAYWLYFGSMGSLRAQTVALLSYIDPVVAIVLSALVLGERMTPGGALGALLVLGATIVSELPEKATEKGNES